MSQMTSLDVNLLDKDCLMEAFREQGYTPIYNEKGQEIHGYGSQKRNANIVITAEDFRKISGGHVYGDIGFEKNKEGYKLHIDHSDQYKFPLNKIKQSYCEKKLYKEVNNDGRYCVESRSVYSKNQIRIRLIQIA